MVVTSRRADRHFEEYGPPFCAELDSLELPSFPGYEVSVKYATEHRQGTHTPPIPFCASLRRVTEHDTLPSLLSLSLSLSSLFVFQGVEFGSEVQG